MVFWGCEVRPGKMVQEVPPPHGYTLHVTQATLGANPKADERTVVKCRTQEKEWIYLCSLTGGATESCQLDLMFEDEVTFAISGKTSVHLVGYLMPSHDHDHGDEEDEDYEIYSSGEEDEEDDSEEDEDEEEDEEEDYDMVPKPKSGVVIKELPDDATNADAATAAGKKDAGKATNGITKKQLGKGGKTDKAAPALAIEAAPTSKKSAAAAAAANGKSAKKVMEEPAQSSESGEEEDEEEDGEEEEDEEDEDEEDDDDEGEEEDEDGFVAAAKKRPANAVKEEPKEAKRQAVAGKGVDKPTAVTPVKTSSKADVERAKAEAKPTPGAQQSAKVEKAEVKTPAKTPVKEEKAAATPPPSAGQKEKDRMFVKTFPNGLNIVTTALGRPEAKAAKQGSRIAVKYVGRLKSNGKIFDSSKSAFTFRLGIGEVIKGWDVGLQGMRVGDKRKITIPPAMAYGVRGSPPQIPGNAWLVFDVELCDVK